MSSANPVRGVALVAALLCFAFLAGLFQVYDHDVGYHLKTGEWIATEGRLPDTDPFSFTRGGSHWPLQQGYGAWLFWKAYDVGGLEGLIAFKSMLAALIFGVVLWIAWRETGSPVLAASAAALGVLAGRYRFYERPELLSALMLALLWACLTSYRRNGGRAPLVLAAGLLAVWANLHAGWIQGMLALGAFAGATTIISIRWRAGLARGPHPPASARSLWATWASALVLSLGTLAIFNPVGPRVLTIPFTMAASDFFRTKVTEFLPLPADNFHAVWALLLLTTGAILIAAARRRARFDDAVVFAVFAWSALQVNRQMLPLSVIAPAILASHARPLLDELASRPLPARLRRLAAPALLAAMALVAWSGFVQGDRFRFGIGIDGRSTPVGAFQFIADNDLPGEVWIEDAWGGAFLWRFWPERRNFVDNRLDVFDEAFFRDVYLPVRDGREDWEEILARYGVSTLLMEITEKPIGIQALAFRSPNWALVYWDDISMIYVRRDGARGALRGRLEYRTVNPNDLMTSLAQGAALPDAIAELERAAGSTASWRSLNGLGVAYGMAGRYADAATAFRRTLALHPGSDSARANLEVAERRLAERAASKAGQQGEKGS